MIILYVYNIVYMYVYWYIYIYIYIIGQTLKALTK